MVQEYLEDGDSSQLSVQISEDPNPAEGNNENDNSELENTGSANSEANMQQELPVSLTLTANESNLEGISLEQKASAAEFVTFSSEVDSVGSPSVKQDPHGFPADCNEVNGSKEAITGLISGENSHATSQAMVALGDEVQITPLRKVQDGDSSPVPGKISCETQPDIGAMVTEDKPLVLHRVHQRQWSHGGTRQKVPAPVSRANSGKYRRTDETSVDTTNPIESVKVAASRFGGSITWKTRRTQPLQVRENVALEVDRMMKQISECKQQAEAAETAKLSVLSEIERTEKLMEEMKHDLEIAQTEDAQAKEELELFQFILQEIDEGAASDDTVAGEILKNIQKRQESVVSQLNLVKNELRNLQGGYDSLLIERGTSIGKSQAALKLCQETEQQVEELTVELSKFKEVLRLERVAYHDAEEHKLRASMAREEECLTWEKDLRQAAEDLAELDAIRSLKVEIDLVQQELEAVQSKEKERRDRMLELAMILQDAAREADMAKSVAANAQEELRKAMEEAEQAKAGLSSLELRIQAALEEIEAANESERVAVDAIRALEESEVAMNVEEHGSPEMVTLDSDEHASLAAKCRRAEELAHEKTSHATAQVKAAMESESLVLSTLGQVSKALEERSRALLAAREQADRATGGKLAMEQELRRRREESMQRRKAVEASKPPEAKPPSAMVIIVGPSGGTKGAVREESYALVHTLSDAPARASHGDGSALQATTKKKSSGKKPRFIERVIMFLVGRRLRAA